MTNAWSFMDRHFSFSLGRSEVAKPQGFARKSTGGASGTRRHNGSWQSARVGARDAPLGDVDHLRMDVDRDDPLDFYISASPVEDFYVLWVHARDDLSLLDVQFCIDFVLSLFDQPLRAQIVSDGAERIGRGVETG